MKTINAIISATPTTTNLLYVAALQRIMNLVSNVEGDIVELGVFKGTNSIVFGKSIKEITPEKKYIGIDTFNGYTADDLEVSKKKVSDINFNTLTQIQESGRWDWSKAAVDNLLEEQDISDVCEIVEGDIKDVISTIKNKIALLYVDCNAYAPAYAGMNHFYDQMDDGAVICIDEHQEGGETQALVDFAKEKGQIIRKTNFTYPDGSPMFIILKKTK